MGKPDSPRLCRFCPGSPKPALCSAGQTLENKKDALVREIKEELENYNDDAEVRLVDFANGRIYDIVVGSDDEDEYDKACTISAV